MNCYLRLILLALIVFSPSCGTNTHGTNTEAQRMADKFWETRLIKCGDSLYDITAIYLREYKGGGLLVEAAPLTEADKLNGYEWNGQTWINATAYREYRGTWGEWIQGRAYDAPGRRTFIHMSKKNGRWFYENVEADSYTASSRKLSCDQIPR